MTERIIGPQGSKRRKRFLWIPMLLIACTALFVIGSAQAVHDEGIFALEGNAITGGTACTDTAQTLPAGCEPANPQSQGFTNTDWSKVYNGTSGAVATSFLTDTFGAADSILSQNTKDIQDVSAWTWKQTSTTSVQDKDDIEHAYAAQYSVDKSSGQCGSSGATANCVLLYLGADRFSNSGDAVMGFWLLKSKVTTVGPDSSGNGTFTGSHTARSGLCPGATCSHGDILVVSDFRAGGKAPQIQIYEWVNSGGSASTNLDQIAGTAVGSFSSCTQAPPEGGKDKNPVPPVGDNDNFCATANQFVVHSPWAFSPKSNSGGTGGNGTLGTPPGTNPDANTKFGVAEFMEGGINMTALGLGNECFNTFYAESRASHSVTSTLSDFAIGSFGSCGAGLSTTSSNTGSYEIGGTAPTDTATVSVKSTGGTPPAPVGDVKFYLCGPNASAFSICDPTGKTAFDTKTLGAGGPADYSVTSTAPTITSAGYYCFAARWPGDTHYTDGPYGDDGKTECFQVTPKQPGISTQVNNENGVSPGTEIYDTATLSGTATPSNATNGTITFTVFGPSDPTCAAVSGEPEYTSVIGVTGNGPYVSRNGDANGDGTPAETNDQFTPTVPGTYHWIAAYTPASGDVNNKSATTACGDAHEASIVQQLQPTMDTKQNFVPNDSAEIKVGTEGGALAGHANFYLFVNDTSCGGGDLTKADYKSGDIAISGGTGTDYDRTVKSGNTTAYDTNGTTFSWVATYTTTNTGHKDVSNPGTNETSSITIQNGTQKP